MQTINTSSLTKRFGATTATDNISIRVDEGEIYGFLGLNGAGKTTLIRMLLGMIKPDSGDVMLFGKKLTSRFDQWNDIGYLVETPYSYPNLSVKENLKIYFKLRQLNYSLLIDRVIGNLKLSHYRNIKAKFLSTGNQQRLGLAKALMHQPRLLILDEPINGLDPEGIVEVRNLLKELSRNGSTIFLSSHILGEVDKLAHRIGIVHEGKLIIELTTPELNNQLIRKLLVQTSDNAKAIQYLSRFNYKAILTENGEIEISDADAIKHSENISKFLVEQGLPPKQLHLSTEDLETYFLRTIETKA
jgi:ABC-2 type transport system ATP-binding protein